jgi:hypothetical protein
VNPEDTEPTAAEVLHRRTELMAIQRRVGAMRMTPFELELQFISFLIGAAPDAVERALDFVERKRAEAGS